MFEQGKITSIFTETLLSLIATFFSGVNKLCTASAEFVASYTDILSKKQLEQLFFVLVILFVIKCVLRSLSSFTRAFDNTIHSLLARAKFKSATSSKGRLGNPRTQFSAKNALNKLIKQATQLTTSVVTKRNKK